MLDKEERDNKRDFTMAMLRNKGTPDSVLLSTCIPYFLGVLIRNLMDAPGSKTPSGTNKKGSFLGILFLSMIPLATAQLSVFGT